MTRRKDGKISKKSTSVTGPEYAPKLASLMRAMPKGHPPLPEFECWIEAVEREPDKMVRIAATQFYVVQHEEFDPVSSKLYRLVGGTHSPNVHCYIGELLTFIAYAAASGVVGNIAYDVLKKFVLPLVAPKDRVKFEERISFEQYESVRQELHGKDSRTDDRALEDVEKEVGLKYRLLIERKWTEK